MILTHLLTACLTFGTAQLALASSLAMTRCYCVSDTDMGWVSIYNLTNPSFRGIYASSSSTVWYRNGTFPRDDFDYPYMCGKECNADRSECWSVPGESSPRHDKLDLVY